MIFRPVFTAAFRHIVFTPPQGEIPNPLPPFFQHLFSSSKLLAENVNGSAVYDTSPLAGDRREIQTGLARDFDGLDDHVAIASSADFAFGTGDFSIECWIYAETTPGSGDNDYIITFGTDILNFSYCNAFGPGPRISYYNPGTGLASALFTNGGDITLNEWHHIAVCRESASTSIFVDGVKKVTAADTYNFPANPLWFGARNDGGAGGYRFDGKIYGVRISRIARYSADFDVTAIKNSYEYDADTIGIWYMSESTGTTCYDAATSTHNGTYTNGPANYPLSNGYGADNLNQFGYSPVLNTLGYSEEFDNAYWTKSETTITPNQLANPVNGEVTADLVFDTVNSAIHQLYHNGVSAPDNATYYTFSAYLKYAGKQFTNLVMSDNGSGHAEASFDLINGTYSFSPLSFIAGAWLDITAQIDAVGSGWYRCSVTAQKNSGVLINAIAFIHNGTITHSGTGTDGVYIFGAQLEKSSTLNAYQKKLYESTWDAKIPLNQSTTDTDCIGNTIIYSGRVPYDGIFKSSNCLMFDGADDYLSVPSLAGTETVTSSYGTSTPSISAGRIDFTAGWCAGLQLSNGSSYDLAEGDGLTAYDRSGNGNHGTLTNGPTWTTQDVYHGNILNGFDLWTEDAGGASLRVSLQDDDTSVKGTGDSITGYTWQSKHTAGNYLIPAETQIDFTGGVTSIASLAYLWETDYQYNDDRFPCNFKTQSSGTEYNFVSYPCTTETFLYSMGFSAWQNSQYLALL